MWYIGSDTGSTYYIAHHGILGQKWGIRRYQNKDGTLTEEGKRRAAKGFDEIRKVEEKGWKKAAGTKARANIASKALPFVSGVTGMAAGTLLGPGGMVAGAAAGGAIGGGLGELVKQRGNLKAQRQILQYKDLSNKMREHTKGPSKFKSIEERDKFAKDYIDAHTAARSEENVSVMQNHIAKNISERSGKTISPTSLKLGEVEVIDIRGDKVGILAEFGNPDDLSHVYNCEGVYNTKTKKFKPSYVSING